MENMIKKIVDADNEAKAMEQNVLKEKEMLTKQINEETQKIYDEYMSKALETIKNNDSVEEKKADKLWEEIKGRQNSAHVKLQSDFELNCDKWVDSIVERTLN